MADDNNDNDDDDDDARKVLATVTPYNMAAQSARFNLIFSKLIINGGNQKQRRSY